MIRLSIIYHSQSGNVHRLAAAAAARAGELGAQTRLRKVPKLADPRLLDVQAYADLNEATADIPDATHDDLVWADAIMIGTPVVFGLPAPELIHFINHSGMVSIPGKLMNKAVSVFTSGAGLHAGQETTILAVHNAVCHWGSLIIPNGSSVDILTTEQNGGLPYGTCNSSWHKPNNVSDDNLAAINYQTTRMIEVATAYQIGLEQTTSSIQFTDIEKLGKKYNFELA